MEWGELIAAAIGGGLITSLINWLAGRGKAKADTSKVLAEATEKLIPPLTQRLDALETEVSKLKRLLDAYAKRVIYLMNGIEALIKQLKAQGEIPCWAPDEWSPEKATED